jgi:2-keto-4-pentenoate hydratase
LGIKRGQLVTLGGFLAPVVVRAGVRARGAFTKLKFEIL